VIVMFFSGSDPFARIVQLVTRSKINHVGIAIEGVYYEATRKGVVHQVLDAPVPLYTRQLPDADLVQRFLNRQVGKQYGVLELVSCWLSAILGIVFYEKDTWICSSLVAAALQEGGVYCPKDPRLMTPQDVWVWLQDPVPMVPSISP